MENRSQTRNPAERTVCMLEPCQVEVLPGGGLSRNDFICFINIWNTVNLFISGGTMGYRRMDFQFSKLSAKCNMLLIGDCLIGKNQNHELIQCSCISSRTSSLIFSRRSIPSSFPPIFGWRGFARICLSPSIIVLIQEVQKLRKRWVHNWWVAFQKVLYKYSVEDFYHLVAARIHNFRKWEHLFLSSQKYMMKDIHANQDVWELYVFS